MNDKSGKLHSDICIWKCVCKQRYQWKWKPMQTVCYSFENALYTMRLFHVMTNAKLYNHLKNVRLWAFRSCVCIPTWQFFRSSVWLGFSKYNYLTTERTTNDQIDVNKSPVLDVEILLSQWTWDRSGYSVKVTARSKQRPFRVCVFYNCICTWMENGGGGVCVCNYPKVLCH